MREQPTYPASAVERAMKVQEVILRAMDGRLKWYQAAEILGISDRQMRRWKQRYEREGYDGLFDRRRQEPSPKRVAVAVVRQVLTLFRERYFDCNVLHFHEKLQAEHGIPLSYTWVKTALQTAGLVAKEARRGTHRKARPRRPLPGMLLHTDASTHAWIPELVGMQDLIAVLDDATSVVYYARFVPQESTTTMMAALKAVVERQGLFCALYTDHGSHFLTTRTGRSPHRPQQATDPTQIQRALGQLGITLIGAHSPQARGRMERFWETWQGRLPQELRLAGIGTVEGANAFLVQTWVPFHNRTWTVPAAGEGTAFISYVGDQLERIFAVQHGRVVSNDNCVQFERRRLQIPQAAWRYSFAKCRVTVYEHLDGTLSLGCGPHTLGRYAADGTWLVPAPADPTPGHRRTRKPVGMTPPMNGAGTSARNSLGTCRSRLDTPPGCPQGPQARRRRATHRERSERRTP
ncbi:ISNCY family transposase [Candidatus Methylomirabilis sp.]|uniref:ISNCY family transposase n=1 Tax=Candidatus Methylomirabilis sp. TaxID=2032687 RepID=UPI003076747B